MKSMFLTAPIVAGKLETWRRFGAALAGERREAFRRALREGGLERLRVWRQEGPDGQSTATALYEGAAPERFLQRVMTANDEFSIWFRAQLVDVHGFDPAHGPPVPAELATDEHAA